MAPSTTTPLRTDRPDPLFLTWDDLTTATATLARLVAAAGMPQVVVGVVRGGMIPAAWLAHRLAIRDVRTVEVTRTTTDGVNADKNMIPTVRHPASLGELTDLDVLLVDDIAGSGVTLAYTARMIHDLGPARVRTAVLAVNRANWAQSCDPHRAIDYIASLTDTWVVFPWEEQHER
ncbi:phosphoribosyltransferase [Streptomyces sp. NPDC059650]|uniref:phosphoribosyltransferase n=1 Tax=Streptomyces sp. NPDC059650 TaxID=3346896 RepID=UPI0036AC98EA